MAHAIKHNSLPPILGNSHDRYGNERPRILSSKTSLCDYDGVGPSSQLHDIEYNPSKKPRTRHALAVLALGVALGVGFSTEIFNNTSNPVDNIERIFTAAEFYGVKTYTIEHGDTLWSIAKKVEGCGERADIREVIDQIQAMNSENKDIQNSMLRPGYEIMVPQGVN